MCSPLLIYAIPMHNMAVPKDSQHHDIILYYIIDRERGGMHVGTLLISICNRLVNDFFILYIAYSILPISFHLPEFKNGIAQGGQARRQ
jgi:hypothetical protein